MVTVKINGKEITVDDGTLILDAARGAGFEIPTFCYQADLMGIGSCRMCLVEIEGQKKLQPSCVTPVMHDMSIFTETSTVVNARAGVLEFLLANHALDCPVCDKGGECELQDMVYKHGPRKGRHVEQKYRFHEKDYALSPVIIKNSNRCVQCMKCVRVCKEVVGANVLGAIGRGHEQEETSFGRSYLDCDHCGNCIEVCPVGCFMRLPYRYKTRPWDLKGSDSVCTYCATGCRLVLEERDGVVIRSKAQLGVGINSETLCARGRFGFDFIQNEQRLTTPLVRKNGTLEPCSWEEALEAVREGLGSVRGENLGGVASARLTNEELYLFQKLIRDLLSSPNVDSGFRWGPGAVESFIDATAMTRGGVSVFDIMEADTVVVAGTNLSDENPIVDYIVRRISATRSMTVAIAHPRAMKLDSSAQMTFRHAPARDGALMAALALGLAEANAERLSSVEGLRALAGKTVEELAASAGVSPDEVRKLSSRLGSSEKVSLVAGTDFLRFPGSTGGLKALREALEALGKKVLVLPVLDRGNQRGAWEMGAHPALEPGYARAARTGLGASGMLDAAATGNLHAMYVAGEDIMSTCPDPDLAKEALSNLRFLVVQDMFLTETAKMAHVVLPSAAFGEKDGTFTNQEGRVQAITKLVSPPGKAKTDHGVIGSVARLFDRSFVSSPGAVFEGVRKEAVCYADVSLEFNNQKNKDNNLDIKEALTGATPSPFEAEGTGAADIEKTAPSGDGEFVLTTGNHLFSSGALSGRSVTLSGLLNKALVEISAEDAERAGLSDGEMVRVTGRHHQADVMLKTRKGTRSGVAFIPEGFAGVPVNRFFKKDDPLPRVTIKKP